MPVPKPSNQSGWRNRLPASAPCSETYRHAHILAPLSWCVHDAARRCQIGHGWTPAARCLNLDVSADRVAQSVEQRTSQRAVRYQGRSKLRSLAREEAEPRRVNAAICWNALRAAHTTAKPVTASATV